MQPLSIRSTAASLSPGRRSKTRIRLGTYYRWTGVIDGKRTTKTIAKEVAAECETRIKNYRSLQKKFEQILGEALAEAPWNDE
jgi:hypothetical protein